MKIIVGQSKNSGKLCDKQFKSVAFNAEVENSIITIATPPSGGTKLSYQVRVLVLIHTKQVTNSKPLSLGDNLMEHKIMLLLHIVPVNIQLRGDEIFSILDD
jgi:hypothetical protein